MRSRGRTVANLIKVISCRCQPCDGQFPLLPSHKTPLTLPEIPVVKHLWHAGSLYVDKGGTVGIQAVAREDQSEHTTVGSDLFEAGFDVWAEVFGLPAVLVYALARQVKVPLCQAELDA